jgi:hypothetical protein
VSGGRKARRLKLGIPQAAIGDCDFEEAAGWG